MNQEGRRWEMVRAYRVALAGLGLWIVAGACLEAGAGVKVESNRVDGLFAVGESVSWAVCWEGEGEEVPSVQARVLVGMARESWSGVLNLAEGAARVEHVFTEPGSARLEVTWSGKGGKAERALGGGMAEPENLRIAGERPVDFDAFWSARLAESASVPLDPQLEKGQAEREGVAYWKVSLRNVRGAMIHGQLARPAEGDKLPALLIPQWAGVYPLRKEWVTSRAEQGWLVLNLMAHDLPIDEPEAYYEELEKGKLSDYAAIGCEDREESYFLKMFVSCLRGADYLASREDWDGRVLVVAGASQGGMQALMAAGLHPKITAAIASVPAGCDGEAGSIGRLAGFPFWHHMYKGRDEARVRATGRYFDIGFFADNIRCPVLVSAGLLDEICPPDGILAAIQRVRAPIEVVVLPVGWHVEFTDEHVAFRSRMEDAWLPTLRRGEAAPVVPWPDARAVR